MRTGFENGILPAEHFVTCVTIAIDLLNGGGGLRQAFKEADYKEAGKVPDSKFAPQMAIAIFLSNLHEHPAFNPAVVLQPTDPNYEIYHAIAVLSTEKASDPVAQQKFVELLPKFKIDRLRQCKITQESNSSGKNSYRLFTSLSVQATEKQPWGPYSDAYCFPPDRESTPVSFSS